MMDYLNVHLYKNQLNPNNALSLDAKNSRSGIELFLGDFNELNLPGMCA